MIACGMGHFLVIDHNGEVWTMGRNNHGQLGIGHTTPQNVFCRVDEVSCAVQVSAADSGFHSAILDDQGDIWLFGYNFCSVQTRTDVEAEKKIRVSPTKVLGLPKIISVSCGYEHIIVLDISGGIWGAGNNHDGQLSSTETSNINTFTRINIPNEMGRVIKICCGSYHTICQSEAEELWGTGKNKSGEVGVGNDENVSHFQRMISLKDNLPVRSFDCGLSHTVVLDTNGGVWATGEGNYGQLGQCDREGRFSLTKMSSIPPIVYINCGRRSTIMLDETGTVYACGQNRFSQFGRGPKESIYPPQAFSKQPRIVQGCSSFYVMMLVDDEGGIWACGENSHHIGRNKTLLELELDIPTETFVQVKGIRTSLSEKRFRNTKPAKT